METDDPWLADLVRRADAGEAISDDNIGQSGTEQLNHSEASEQKIEALAEMICRPGNEPENKSAALLVLMSAIENAAHPKALANVVKHAAFARCGELDAYHMVQRLVAMIESDMLAYGMD